MKLPNDYDTLFARDKLSAECETMKRLLLGLMDSRGKISEEVHKTRKLGKTLRGGFKLFRLGHSSSRDIQAIGRLLSGPRDAVSRFNTWTKLAWNSDVKASAAIFGLLEQQTHSAARRPPQATVDWCMDRVISAQRKLLNLPPELLSEKVAIGLKKLERKTVRRCKKLHHQKAEDFHEARKALKAWLGAVGFLPEGTIEVNPVFPALAERLGDENDLATLSNWLLLHGFTPEFVPDLWIAVDAARLQLQNDVIADLKGPVPLPQEPPVESELRE